MAKEYTLIGGNGTVVSPLEVTEDGDYVAGDSRAFNPVKVRTGSSGSSTLSGLTDVDISNPTDGQTLVYNATSGKWENGSGGGGGGILYVGMDMSTFTLDKTWQEIYDSDLSVLKIEAPDGSSKDAYMLSTAYIEGTEGVNASYGVTFYCITTTDSQPSMEAISFSASTRNDYPAITSHPA